MKSPTVCPTHAELPCRCAEIAAATARLAISIARTFGPPPAHGTRWFWRESIEAWARCRGRDPAAAVGDVGRAIALAFGEDAAAFGEMQKEG